MVAASILPVTIHNDELYFLFGKENEMEDSAKGFSDFGGGVEQGESIFDTALREGSEELCGFLGNSKQLSQLIQKNGGTYNITYGSDDKAYHVHIFFLEYDKNLPKYFTNHHHFLWEKMDKKLLNKSKLFEKQEINWFSLKDIHKNKIEFRPFYKAIIEYVLQDLSKIHNFIKKKERKNIKNRSKTMKMKGG
jgi:8-oxo-dGTP pyrophosphatase MutT (NUDIX family)